MKTVVGLYDNKNNARNTVQALVDAGFDRSDISLIMPDQNSEYRDLFDGDDDTVAEETGEAAASGAVAGGLLGGAVGVLVGLGVFTIPGVGPVVAAGPIIAGLTGAGVGALTGGLVGALIEWGVPDDEAHYYAEGVRRGSTLVAVRADDDRVREVVSAMNRYNPIDVEKRAKLWRSQGWSEHDDSGPYYSAMESQTERTVYRDQEYSEYEPTYREHFNVNLANSGNDFDYYRPHYRYGYNLAHESRYQGQNWYDFEEEVRADWQHAHQDGDSTWEEVKQAIRTGWEKVKDAFDGDDDYSYYESSYRDHYNQNFAHSAYGYHRYEPAYAYGYDMATTPQYRNRTWNDIETDVRRDWENEHEDSAWDDFKDAVRYGWEQVKDAFDGDDDDDHAANSYRSHFYKTYADSNYGYARYASAYAYGYEVARKPQYRSRDWDDIRDDVRRDWETNNRERAWEEFKDAIYHGWEQVKDAFDDDDRVAGTYRQSKRRGVRVRDYDDANFGRYEDDYRRHHEETYNGVYTYDQVKPAYRFGYNLGLAPGALGLDWTAVEADARTRWEAQREGTWEDYKDSVRYGWSSVRERVV